jgi:hypothetical protein
VIEKFLIVTDPNKEPSIVTLDGLKREVSRSFFRYFAPVAAIYREIQKTADMPTAWQRQKLDEDRTGTYR